MAMTDITWCDKTVCVFREEALSLSIFAPKVSASFTFTLLISLSNGTHQSSSFIIVEVHDESLVSSLLGGVEELLRVLVAKLDIIRAATPQPLSVTLLWRLQMGIVASARLY